MSANDYQEVLWVYEGHGGLVEKDDPKVAETHFQKYWLSTAEYKQHS